MNPQRKHTVRPGISQQEPHRPCQYKYNNRKPPHKPYRTNRRRRRQLRLKCTFFVSTFTLSLFAGIGLHMYTISSNSRSQSVASTLHSDPDAGKTAASLANGKAKKKEHAKASTQNKTGTDSPATTKWNLVLVNKWNPIPDNFNVELTPLQNGHSIDSRCYPALQDMLFDCRCAGLSPLICSSYRTMQKQQSLFYERMNELAAQGYSTEDAYAKAATSVAIPGTSEHQIGLALDIVDQSHQALDASQENTPVQQWLMQNSWKYGFILRYPSDKSELTGIIYEPWHYRYVGKKAAKEIFERGICLEEYLAEDYT